jgi:outer membrane biosynthesis protein TonB
MVAPPIPTPILQLAANEDDTPRPLDFVQAGTKPAAPTGRRRLAIILGAAITLALLFIPGLHIGNTSNPGFASQEMLAPAHNPNILLLKTPTPTMPPKPTPTITPSPTPTPTPAPIPTPTTEPTLFPTPTPKPPVVATPKATPTKIPRAIPTPSPTAANNSGGFTGLSPFHPGTPPDPPSSSPFSDPLVYVLLGLIIAACAALVVIVKKTRILGK